MAVDITMPQLSDTMSEGTLVKWLKKVGDAVRLGETIAEIETDKATMDMESFDAGTISEILIKEGGKVGVGQPIARLETGKGGGAEGSAPKGAGTAGGSSARAAGAESPRQQAAIATASRPASSEMHEPDSVDHGATREPARAVPPMKQDNGHRVHASPLARKIAADQGIDLAGVKGSGPNGRIVQRDIAAAGKSSSAAPVGPKGGQVIALSKMRLAIARNLVASKQNIPHFYESIDVDVEELSQLRSRMNEALAGEKIKLSLGDFVSKAVATALLLHPALNATFDGTQVTRHAHVNLGMAVAIPDGLMVPVLRGVQQRGLRDIRQASVDLVDRARNQRLKPDEMRGATFTVSNLGTYGIKSFSAIINPPEVAILAIAAAQKRAVVRNDEIVARTMMTLTLSADHRVVDGATAAEFLRTLKGLLEEPGMMLA